MQILILLSAMIASLTGLVVGERPVARSQVERSVDQRGDTPAAKASQQAARPASRVRGAKALPCLDQARGGAEAPVRSSRSILLLKRAWLE